MVFFGQSVLSRSINTYIHTSVANSLLANLLMPFIVRYYMCNPDYAGKFDSSVIFPNLTPQKQLLYTSLDKLCFVMILYEFRRPLP